MKNRPIDKLLNPFRTFASKNYAVGLLLFLAATAAMVWANSPFKHYYFELWEYRFNVGPQGKILTHNLHHWINDGLMAVFFFLVGLEIKREVLAGRLSNIRQAVLPAGAALGGMVIPACVYLLFNPSPPNADGWGIPMATDIAFSLGLISLVRSKVPIAVKIFLVALAIVDDLGAVLVIAFFYSSDISLIEIAKGLGFIGLMIGGNLLRVRSAWFYSLIGICGVWFAFMFSGVHATIAGVLAAFTIPARTVIGEQQFSNKLKQLLEKFKKTKSRDGLINTKEELEVIEEVIETANKANTPLQKIENTLYPLVYFFIMPVFAFANAGITLHADIIGTLGSSICLGIIFGLVVGKFCGVTLFSWILVKTKLGKLPDGATWTHIFGVALLAGIGFTMSLFISSLAFSGEAVLKAKTGVLIASALSSILGLGLLHLFGTKEQNTFVK